MMSPTRQLLDAGTKLAISQTESTDLYSRCRRADALPRGSQAQIDAMAEIIGDALRGSRPARTATLDGLPISAAEAGAHRRLAEVRRAA